MAFTLLKNAAQSLRERLQVKDLENTAPALRHWLQSDFGRYLQVRERRVIEEHFSQLPGYRLMRLGLTSDPETLDCFNHIHRFSMHPNELEGAHSALSTFVELPLMSETIDVLLLQHALEFSRSPKAVLAEASRVVMPGVHILLCAFNPYGPMGMAKFSMQLCFGHAQYSFHNLRLGRVIDWLSLLNFHVMAVEHGAYNVPLNYPHLIYHDSRWEKVCQKARLPMGNFYMIHAIKRVPRGIINPAKSLRAAVTGYRVTQGLKHSAERKESSHSLTRHTANEN